MCTVVCYRCLRIQKQRDQRKRLHTAVRTHKTLRQYRKKSSDGKIAAMKDVRRCPPYKRKNLARPCQLARQFATALRRRLSCPFCSQPFARRCACHPRRPAAASQQQAARTTVQGENTKATASIGEISHSLSPSQLVLSGQHVERETVHSNVHGRCADVHCQDHGHEELDGILRGRTYCESDCTDTA